jgi:hypothetical protein
MRVFLVKPEHMVTLLVTKSKGKALHSLFIVIHNKSLSYTRVSFKENVSEDILNLLQNL